MQNRASNVQKGRVISRRLFMLAAAKLLLFAGITSRLYSLQISDGILFYILDNSSEYLSHAVYICLYDLVCIKLAFTIQ